MLKPSVLSYAFITRIYVSKIELKVYSSGYYAHIISTLIRLHGFVSDTLCVKEI